MNRKLMLISQRNEITEYYIYAKLAERADKENKKVLQKISRDEKRHYELFKEYTKTSVKPNKIKIWLYLFLAQLFGLAFSLKLMERGERIAQKIYKTAEQKKLYSIYLDEQQHEKTLLRLLKDDRVTYAGAIVLGLNDALVELTGALAGMTFALQNNRVIALIGFITGFAATLSMAASGFLSSREAENDDLNPMKSALYTGIAYIIVVGLLILPYVLFSNPYTALGCMLFITIIIISSYTFYISIAKEVPFWRRFIEMALISIGVAALTFIISLIIRSYFNIEI